MSATGGHPHESAMSHVTGTALYLDDIPSPRDCLHLAFGLASVSSGRIDRMDLDPVRQADGVIRVLTSADLPGPADTSPVAHDEPLLACDHVSFHGQPLFLVAAESHRAARLAARCGRIDLTPDDPILTIDAAIAAGPSARIEDPVVYLKGDPEAAIASAPRAISGRVETGGQEHFYLEGQAAMAIPQESGGMFVHSSSQHPSEIQEKVSEALGLPLSAVRTEVRRMGGGFGGKESQCNAPAIACAVMARITGRPCRMRYDRDDDMAITGKRHDFRIDYRVGFDQSGHILGIVFDHYVRCGWSQDLSAAVADRAMLHADNAYHLPNVRITSHRLRTHTVSATAFRGFGGPQGMFGIEHVMEQMARTLGCDPLEVRTINFYRSAGPLETGTSDGTNRLAPARAAEDVETTPYHMPITDSVIREIVDELAERSDYHARRQSVSVFNAWNQTLKRGLALTPVKFGISFTLTHYNQAGALVHVYRDGSVQLNHGGTEMGQGLFTKVAQVAATTFGLPLEAVRLTATDTGKVPNSSATAASSGSDLNGMAVRAASVEIRDRMATFLAERWQRKPSTVRFEAGRVWFGDESISFGEAARLAYEGRIALSETGFYATPDIAWDRRNGRGRPFYYFAYGAAVTEVVIDTLSGESRILRTDILHDAGRSLNPAIDIGQIEGGYVQGAGWLTTEELVWDAGGRLLTHAPSTYKIPACSDRPIIFNVSLFDNTNREDTIFRSKATGEPPLMLGISAFMAISDAVAACGDRGVETETEGDISGLDAPATPERVLRAIGRLRGEYW